MDNLINEIIDICKLPFDEVGKKFKVVQVGENIIYISNYMKLLDYSLNKIALKVKKDILEINGENLKISLMNKKEIVINGKINSFGIGLKNDK